MREALRQWLLDVTLVFRIVWWACTALFAVALAWIGVLLWGVGMGWAARAKVRTGNPKHHTGRLRFVSASKANKALSTHEGAIVRFSDRAYVMDRKGVMRRAQPKEGDR